MLFFRESCRRDAADVPVPDFAAWIVRSDSDYETPEKRQMRGKEISIPLLPARVMNERLPERACGGRVRGGAVSGAHEEPADPVFRAIYVRKPF